MSRKNWTMICKKGAFDMMRRSVMCALLLVVALCGTAFGSTWLDTADTSWFSMTGGTEDAPFMIGTPEQLAGIAKICADKDGGDKFDGKFVALSCDIDLSAREWRPIGWFVSLSERSHFQGTFDGRGHTIRGLRVTTASGAGEPDYKNSGYGLFSQVGPNGTIKNLRIDGLVRGDDANGIEFGAVLAAHINGSTIENAVVSGDVEVSHGRGYAGGAAAAGGKQDAHNIVVYGRYRAAGTINYAGGLVGYGFHQSIGRGKWSHCLSLASVTVSGGREAAGLGSGILGDVYEDCMWLTSGDRPKTAGVGEMTGCGGIASESEAPVAAVLLGDPSRAIVPLDGGEHEISLALYPAGGRRSGISAAWSFPTGISSSPSADGLSVKFTAPSSGATDAPFSVKVSGIVGMSAPAELSGTVEFYEDRRVAMTAAPSSPWLGQGTLTFTSAADRAGLLAVLVDDAMLAQTEYAVRDGSTIITLSEELLKTLAVGAHRMKIISREGYAEAAFEVKDPTRQSSSGGGCSTAGACIGMAAAALIARRRLSQRAR